MYIPDEALTIINVLENNGHEAYIVGGCVRDMFLGIIPKDFDICTSAYPEQVLKLFSKSIPTGIKHGTVTVFVNDLPFEVTTFRIESIYTDHRHPDSVRFSDSLTEDLKRRDFTINAIAYHPVKGIIDPFNGISDLKNKIIRTVGNPSDRFAEDALRMLRAIRFQARYGFSIDADTFSAIKKHSKNITAVSRERILEELNSILLASFPEAFQNLFITKLFKYIFSNSFSGITDFALLKKMPEDLPTRWSASFRLLSIHDVKTIKEICSSLKMSNKLKNEIVKISVLLNSPLPNNIYMLRKTLSEVSVKTFTRFLNIKKTLGTNKKDLMVLEKSFKQIASEKHCLSLSSLAVNGSDLINAGCKPGKHLGTILDTLFICVLQKPELNRKDLMLLFTNIIKQAF